MVSAKPDFPEAGNPDGAYEPDEGADNAAIRIVLADSQAIYRVGIRKIFALEDDIRVVAQVDTLAGLHGAIQRFPTDMIGRCDSRTGASSTTAENHRPVSPER